MNRSSIPSRYQGILIQSLGERNGYHDSDWYVLLWDVEKQAPRSQLCATTACGGGDMWYCPYGLTDLLPEHAEAYRAWSRRREIQKRWDERRRHIARAGELGLTRREYARLRQVEFARFRNDEKGAEALYLLEQLLGTKNFRSSFRKSLADQVRAWVREESPKFRVPLSPKQMASLSQYTPYRRSYR